MKLLTTFILALLCSISAFAAPHRTDGNDSILLSGTVSDAFTRENMPDVEVCASDGSGFIGITKVSRSKP